ncbi:MAG: DNA phosphorothioation-associated putative methyltransferase [Alphaproteobacteria bacterium]|nr:DNA phosphorothioation-associated putative methyltransferase [Alphaproteobacteria bacterium]
MTRKKLSRPVRLSEAFGFYSKKETILDYGCGRGFDVAELARKGFPATGWDPHFFPGFSKEAADTVNLGYVLNVIEDAAERKKVLKDAFALANKRLVVAVRPADAANGLKKAKKLGDGFVTKSGTFQKFFSREELGAYLADVTGTRPYIIASGIAVLFKNEKAEAAFIKAWAAKHHGRKIQPYRFIRL